MAFNNTNSNQSQSTSSNQITEDDATAQNKKKNDLVIFVDKDSDDKLDELFNKTLGNKLPLQVPFKMRNFPPSFFMPPSSGSKSPSVSHSRENSADSAFGSGTTIGSNNTTTAPSGNPNVTQSPVAPSAIPSGLVVHHSRAHSSPASLGKLPLNLNLNLSSLNLGNVTPTNPSISPSPDHTAASSTTVSSNKRSNVLNNSNSSDSSSTSVVANTAKTPNSANSNATTTTNQQAQPQQQTTNSHNNNLPHNILDRTLQHIHSRGRSYDIPSLQQQIQFGELPPGWEQAKTQDGRIYYIK
jgi:transcriptional coactivator YAP1